MPYRSPARFLAPLALIAAVATIYVVAKPQLDRVRGDDPPVTSSTATAPATTTAKQPAKKAAKKKAKTYTVKSGDSLGGVAEKTGVSQADLLTYNDIADPSSLSVGQKLKLTAP